MHVEQPEELPLSKPKPQQEQTQAIEHGASPGALAHGPRLPRDAGAAPEEDADDGRPPVEQQPDSHLSVRALPV
eukprot:8580163-Pyramimonas_sp.AAC.1